MDLMQPRVLQTGAGCDGPSTLVAPFNSDDRVPPYVGVMFEVYARQSLEILTLELDVIRNATDLSVEVYSKDGSFDDFMNVPEAWTLASSTQGIPFRENGAVLIPVTEFDSISMQRGETRSIYITMKGAFLDHTVYALQKTGEVHVSDSFLDVMVGAGFTEYKFPDERDRLVNPQFAGVIHYRHELECSSVVTRTSISYPFIIDDNGGAVASATVETSVTEAMDLALTQNSLLESFVGKYGLKREGGASSKVSSYDGTLRVVF